MRYRGKKYRNVKELLSAQSYNLPEAVSLLKKTNTTNFDAACEIHVRLGIDPSQAEQSVRSTVTLPHGTGKKMRVIAFVMDDLEKTAKDAGAIEAGLDTLIEKINKGWLDFDVAVAVPEAMKKIGKIAKTLGQRGLMPNPKAGTIGTDIAALVSDVVKGKIEFRNDKQGNLHNVFGRASFDEQKLFDNAKAYLHAVLEHKPSGVKGVYIRSITMATTMGPGIHLDVASTLAAVRTS